MKHFIKKSTFAGASFSPPRQKILAGTLRAPQLGNFDISASYSTIEIVDLLCDGPIYGIVNDEGADVTNDHLMQGIYLDNTPIEVSNSKGLVNNFDVKYSLPLITDEGQYKNTYYISNQLNYLTINSKDDAGLTIARKSRLFELNMTNTFFCAEYIRTGAAKTTESNIDYIESIDFPFIRRDSALINKQNYLYYNPSGNGIGNPLYEEVFSNTNNVWDRIIWDPSYNTIQPSNIKEIDYGHYFINKQDGLILDPQFINIAEITSELHYYNQQSSSSLDTANSLYSVFLSNLRKIKNTAAAGTFTTPANQQSKIKAIAGSLILELESLRKNYFGDNLLGRKTPSNKMLMFISIGTVDFAVANFKTLSLKSSGLTANINTDVLKMYITNFDWEDGDVKIYFIPEVTDFGYLTGRVCGLIAIYIDLNKITLPLAGRGVSTRWQFPNSISSFSSKDLTLALYKSNQNVNQGSISTPAKFNFNNLLCEFKNGEEKQQPLGYFNAIHIDYEYGQQLLGPFRTAGKGVRRLQEDPELRTTWGPNFYQEIGGRPSLTNGEGVETSVDSNRKSKENYSEWNKDNDFNEDASPVIHTIENPNVRSVYFTLGISSLKDTASSDITYNKEVPKDGEEPKIAKEDEFLVGDTYPAILVIAVEWGKVEGGVVTVSSTRQYRIVCQVEGQLLIDFGQPDATAANIKNQRFVTDNKRGGKGNAAASFQPLKLPDITEDENSTKVKRYVKVTKVSTETNSVLISRECSLVKVTEIIDANLVYPFSAVAGIKMDSRVFSSIPERSYDCRLKKIKIPTNYFPLAPNGIDQRYILNAAAYQQNYKIYQNDWDGTFKEGWTDNPAWILYDMLTNTRYGLGSYLEESQINIWELYKIGRFCDAVNDEGYFIGVSDGIKGLEPRFSCNILFKDSIKIFDAINVIANLFRGAVFFANSEIHFIDDRPRSPIALFSNTHVKDGIFSYSNNRRDQQFNTIEVSFLDRFDNFNTKIEFVEDEADIRKRGIFKTTINTIGVTSRSMARRIGQHMIYQTIKENQGVEFKAGLESLLCRPGDLIIIEDEMKTQQTNFGRILKKDSSSKSLYIENEFNSGAYNNKITVYSPTGYTTSDELDIISSSNRSRLTDFTLSNGGVVDASLATKYVFSHYLPGFTASNTNGLKGNEQEFFAYYTGKNSTNQKVFCYYNTGFSGWIFSIEKSFTDDINFDKLILNTGVYTIDDTRIADYYTNRTGFIYDTSRANRRSASIFSDIHTQIAYSESNRSIKGILDEEISAVNNPQVVTFDITGYNNNGLNNNNYGSVLYLSPTDTNINLLEFVQDGSPYRIERKNSESQIYKVLTIREENQNEYTVVATKYNTGKFAEIENFASNLLPEDTFNTAPVSVNNIIVEELAAPEIVNLTFSNNRSDGFYLNFDWMQANNALGYELIFTNNKGFSKSYTTDKDTTQLQPDYRFQGFGYWTAKVRSLGNGSTLLNSYYAEKTIFVAYLSDNNTSVPLIINYSIS